MTLQQGVVPQAHARSRHVRVAEEAEASASPERNRVIGAALLTRRGASTLLLIAGIIVLAAALVSGSLAAQERRTRSQALYSHTLEVMAVAREVLSSAQDFEIGHRGYLLSRDA